MPPSEPPGPDEAPQWEDPQPPPDEAPRWHPQPPRDEAPRWGDPQPPAPPGGHLHPAAIAVWTLPQSGVLVFVLIVNPGALLFLLPFLVLVGVANVVRWNRFTWRLEARALVIEQGLVTRQRRVIPFERIQSVDLVRRISHRLFGVVAVRVEAIGGGATEGQLDALAPAMAEQVRSALLAAREQAGAPGGTAAAEAADEGEEVLARSSPRDLLLAGLTEANATVIAAVFGGLWQVLGERVERLERIVEAVPRLGGPTTFVAVALLALVVLLGLSVLGQVVTFWGFSLSRTPDSLVIRRGLLEQRHETIPFRRVQSLRIEENPLRRMIGRATVRADVAGRPGGGGETGTLLPIGTRADALALVAEVLARDDLEGLRLQPMPLRARRRRWVRAVAGTAAATIAAVGFFGLEGVAALALGLPAALVAEASYHALGRRELPGLVVARAGWWTRRTAFVPVERLQAVEAAATLPQRLRNLATVELHIARSPGVWTGPRLVDVDAGDARRLLVELTRSEGSRELG